MFKYNFSAAQYHENDTQAFLLDKKNIGDLNNYLEGHKFLKGGEKITNLETIGNSTMNLVLRAFTLKRSFIIKQARPWMERNPRVLVSRDRIIGEEEFYKLTNGHFVLGNYHPACLFFDKTSYILILQDLGPAMDFSYLYKQNELKTGEALSLVRYLINLHSDFKTDMIYERIFNRDIRKMNSQDMFNSPFSNNDGLHLLPDLMKIGMPFIHDKLMVDKIKYLGRLYESDGNYLLHGDFSPSNWLSTSSGIKVIDCEFCFFGPCEFDLGVFLAHLLISGQSKEILHLVIAEYKSKLDFNLKLVLNYAGVEIFHRMLGVDQLPVNIDIDSRKELMAEARKMLMLEESSHIWELMETGFSIK